ncbi:spindle and kinetochore-associated protein 1 [Sergentomyia squamirostris]
MDLREIMEQRKEKVEMLKLHFAICKDKEKYRKDLKELQDLTTEMKDLLVEANRCIERWPAVKKKYKDEMLASRKMQLYMLEVMKHVEDVPKGPPKLPVPEINILDDCSNPQNSLRTPRSIKRQPTSSIRRSASCPRSSRSNAFSPFPVVPAPTFLEFDFEISQADFTKIPKYMCGRDNRDDLQNFLDTVIGQCFVQKYSMMANNRKSLSIREWNLYDLFYEQEKEFPQRRFITQGDISRFMGKMIDKKINNRIQMLKFIKVLQEVRKKSSIFFIWNQKQSSLA